MSALTRLEAANLIHIYCKADIQLNIKEVTRLQNLRLIDSNLKPTKYADEYISMIGLKIDEIKMSEIIAFVDF